MPIVLKSGGLNFLEPSGTVQACTGIALPSYIGVCLPKDPIIREMYSWCSLGLYFHTYYVNCVDLLYRKYVAKCYNCVFRLILRHPYLCMLCWFPLGLCYRPLINVHYNMFL